MPLRWVFRSAQIKKGRKVLADDLEDWTDTAAGHSKNELKEFVERQLVSRLAAGDRWALRTLYEIYFPRLAAFFAHLTTTSDPSITEQLINATLLDVWRFGATFEPNGAVYVWIMRMALGHARHRPTSRSSRRAGAYSRSAMLATLSIEERAVVHLVYTGRSRGEIAEILGVSIQCVDTLLAQARLVSSTYANLGTDAPPTVTDSQNIAVGRTQRPLSP